MLEITTNSCVFGFEIFFRCISHSQSTNRHRHRQTASVHTHTHIDTYYRLNDAKDGNALLGTGSRLWCVVCGVTSINVSSVRFPHAHMYMATHQHRYRMNTRSICNFKGWLPNLVVGSSACLSMVYNLVSKVYPRVVNAYTPLSGVDDRASSANSVTPRWGLCIDTSAHVPRRHMHYTIQNLRKCLKEFQVRPPILWRNALRILCSLSRRASHQH